MEFIWRQFFFSVFHIIHFIVYFFLIPSTLTMHLICFVRIASAATTNNWKKTQFVLLWTGQTTCPFFAHNGIYYKKEGLISNWDFDKENWGESRIQKKNMKNSWRDEKNFWFGKKTKVLWCWDTKNKVIKIMFRTVCQEQWFKCWYGTSLMYILDVGYRKKATSFYCCWNLCVIKAITFLKV